MTCIALSSCSYILRCCTGRIRGGRTTSVGDSQSNVIDLCECVSFMQYTHSYTYALYTDRYCIHIFYKNQRVESKAPISLTLPVVIPQVALWHEHSIISVNIAKYHIYSFVHSMRWWPPPLRRFIPPGAHLSHDAEESLTPCVIT